MFSQREDVIKRGDCAQARFGWPALDNRASARNSWAKCERAPALVFLVTQ